MIDSWNVPQDFIPIESIRWDSSWPESAKDDRHDLLSYIEDRFGIKKTVFDDYLLFRRNKSWWFLKQSGMISQASLLKVAGVGLKAFQSVGQYIKPTTRMIQIFGRYAVRAMLDLHLNDMKKMANGMNIYTDADIDNGYVILSFRGVILGLGLLIDGRVTSQMPRRDLVSFIE